MLKESQQYWEQRVGFHQKDINLNRLVDFVKYLADNLCKNKIDHAEMEAMDTF